MDVTASPSRPVAASPFEDERLYDFRNYPADLYVAPGASAANRAAFAKWGAWANAFGAKEYGRPLFMVASADLSGSTNISGFAERYGDFPGYGWYERFGTADGVLLPQEITEFANAGILIGMTTVNFARDPEQRFDGFWGACSTYGSFSYLKYGPMRLFSQLAQDCELKIGKMIWVAGHSGPETAEDSRTHFGIYSPGVTQLFPDGAIINLHPWEYNEVPVLLGAALREKAPIVALHLTRPPVTIPDRAGLGIPSHFEAARGAYVIRDYRPGPRGGAVIVQGAERGGEHHQGAAGARHARDQRQDHLRDQPATVRLAARGVPAQRAGAIRLRRFHRDHNAGALADARLAVQQGRRGVCPLGRLGQPLAHRRRGG